MSIASPRLTAEFQSSKARKTLGKGLAFVGGLVSKNPSVSFPKLTGNGSQLNNIYRFLGHKDVTSGLILEPHFKNTVQRAMGREVLALHDTTDIVLSGKRGDLGYINRESFGFKAHVVLLVSADGRREPLGVIGLETINRPQEVPAGNAKQRQRPAEEKRQDPLRESERWWRGIQNSEQTIGDKSLIINIGDSETDNYALIARCIDWTVPRLWVAPRTGGARTHRSTSGWFSRRYFTRNPLS